jgi:hypothetical protein
MNNRTLVTNITTVASKSRNEHKLITTTVASKNRNEENISH